MYGMTNIIKRWRKLHVHKIGMTSWRTTWIPTSQRRGDVGMLCGDKRISLIIQFWQTCRSLRDGYSFVECCLCRHTSRWSRSSGVFHCVLGMLNCLLRSVIVHTTAVFNIKAAEASNIAQMYLLGPSPLLKLGPWKWYRRAVPKLR
jgi:hypothetical protein